MAHIYDAPYKKKRGEKMRLWPFAVLFGVKLETTFAFEPEMNMENGWSKIKNEKKEVHINISVLSCVNGHYSSLCIMERTSGQKRESVHFL
jgi:hypothetical protein